jgi:hypothetical protein
MMKELFLKDFSPADNRQKLIDTLCKEQLIDISIAYSSDFKSAKKLREIVDSLCK